MNWSLFEATSTHILDNLPKMWLFLSAIYIYCGCCDGFWNKLSAINIQKHNRVLGFAPRDTNICNPAGAAICSGIGICAHKYKTLSGTINNFGFMFWWFCECFKSPNFMRKHQKKIFVNVLKVQTLCTSIRKKYIYMLGKEERGLLWILGRNCFL